MPKRLYTTPSAYWRLPDGTDLALLRDEIDAAMVSGASLVLEVEFEGTLAELTLKGSAIGAYALVDIPLPNAETLDDVI
jgi:hypothetical protein